MRALNARAFDDPLEHQYFKRQAGEGLWSPSVQRIHLRSGQFYYRFVDINRTPQPDWADGSWWVDFETFRRMREFAEIGGQEARLTLGYCARLFLAIAYEFSEVNGYVRALLTHPLDAFAGRGRPIRDGDARAQGMKWRPPPDVMQLYIPYLVPRPGVLPVGRVAFSLIECHRIASGVFK